MYEYQLIFNGVFFITVSVITIYFLRTVFLFLDFRRTFRYDTYHRAELLSNLIKRARQERDRLMSSEKENRIVEEFRIFEAEAVLQKFKAFERFAGSR